MVSLLSVSLALVFLAHSAGQKTKKVVLISWDGAPYWIVKDMVSAGKLPALAQLSADGLHADGLQPAFPSKTAVGHASIFTGNWPDVHGVTNNSVPVMPRTSNYPTTTLRGFDSASIQIEPLTVTAARQGKRVISLSSTQSFPSEKWTSQLKPSGMDKNLSIYSGFESAIVPNRMLSSSDFKQANNWTDVISATSKGLEARVSAADTVLELLLIDDPKDPITGYDTLCIRVAGHSSIQTIKPRRAGTDLSVWSKPVALKKGDWYGNTFFRLYTLSPDGKNIELWQRAANAVRGYSSEAQAKDYLATYTGFHADAWFDYEKGLLGTTYPSGGTGDAEERAIELVRFDCDLLTKGLLHMAKRYKPDLLTHYTPQSDSAGHVLMGYIDPDVPGYNLALARKLRPYYEQVLQLQDQWLGTAYKALSKDYAFIVVSDHGMEGTGRRFYINKVLADAGLVVFDTAGKMILEQSKVFAPSWGEFGVVVNDTTWKGGIVTPSQRAMVIEAATNALLAARDPETGTQIVRGVFDSTRIKHLGLGGQAGQDLYLDFAVGYAPSSAMSLTVASSLKSLLGAGVHGFFPLREKMQAICYLGGHGVPQRGTLRSVRQIDVHPTVCELLGIKPSPDSIGRSLLH